MMLDSGTLRQDANLGAPSPIKVQTSTDTYESSFRNQVKGFEESFGGSVLQSSSTLGNTRQSGAFIDSEEESDSGDDVEKQLEEAAETLKGNNGKTKKKKKITKESANKGCGQEACCIIF